MAKGNNKVFMPFETSGIMGAIGSIKNLEDINKRIVNKHDVNQKIDVELDKELNRE
jgi:hypothetical protein